MTSCVIRQPVNVLEQLQPDGEASGSRASLPLAKVERDDLAIDKVPIDPAGESAPVHA
jgi:hypothetical protein